CNSWEQSFMMKIQSMKHMVFIRISGFRSLTSRRMMSHITLMSIYDSHEVIRRQPVLFKLSRLSSQLLLKLLIKETDCLNHLPFSMFYRHFSILLSEPTLRVLQELIQSPHFSTILATGISTELPERMLNIICWN